MQERNIVFVTGSSRGLGASIIETFARHNYDVIINYHTNYDQATKLEERIIKNYHVNTLCLKGDVSNEEDVKRMTLAIKEKFGKIDVLVNNAGISLDNNIQDKTALEFQKVVETNLLGTFLVSKHISDIMTSGTIINISSTDGIDTNYIEEIDYASSKAGIISLTKTFAKALAPNIRVNAVAPGWINTDMTKDLEPNFRKQEENKILLKRFASPEEVAQVVFFLASPNASYINSTVIRVDGGY